MKVIKYTRPYGRRSTIDVTVSSDLESQALEMQEAGWEFDLEDLMLTGELSVTCSNDEDSLAGFIYPAGTELHHIFSVLVEDSYVKWVKMGKPVANDWRVSDRFEDDMSERELDIAVYSKD